IIESIDREKAFKFKYDGKEVRITREMLIIAREVPESFVEAEFKFGFIYLNTERTSELDAEGFSREVSRNIQQLRKKAGLEKLEQIRLFLMVSEKMKESLVKYQQEIKEKVGAVEFVMTNIDAVKKHDFSGEFKIKKEEFKVWFDKVEE
ncbi:MAG: hypothetical protein KJ771_07650, partial [Nanoarchaeota archaeon]|nr:hypothetical protein [Nanoarchaeota archaeon]